MLTLIIDVLVRSGRREGYPSRPPTPPCVRFRTRRFKCSAADPGVESEGSGVLWVANSQESDIVRSSGPVSRESPATLSRWHE